MSIYRGVGSGLTSDALTTYLSILADIIAARDAAIAAQVAAELAETNAGLSETAAAASEIAAGLSETAAAGSAAAALVSQGLAATSATNANTDALLAKDWATKIGSTVDGVDWSSKHFATLSQGYAGTAVTARIDAQAARDLAQTYAANALASENAAAASYDAFDDRYLGSKAADPTLDNDGNALLTGALYWNTVSSALRVYNGTAWVGQIVSTLYKQTWTAPNGTTVFTPTVGYTPGYIDVYVNGVRYISGTDYTATNGTTVVLAVGTNTDDIVETVNFAAVPVVIPLSSVLDDLDDVVAPTPTTQQILKYNGTDWVNSHFAATEYNAGNSGAALTLNFNNGINQRTTLTAACSVTLSNPTAGMTVKVKLTQDGVGSRTITWVTTIKWSNGTAPTLSTAIGAIDIVSLYYDGTTWFGQAATGFA